MMRRWLYPLLIFLFSALGLTVLAASWYMPQIREAMVFAPARRDVEAGMRRIADGQKAAMSKTGKFVALSTVNTAPGSITLGLDWTSLAALGFQYDAAVQPNRQLRLRALPQPDAVRDLKVPPQMYVADLSPRGDLIQGAWVP